jgi:hypothetical protein
LRGTPPIGQLFGELAMMTSHVLLGTLIGLQLLAGCSPGEAAHDGTEPLPAPTGPHKTGRVSFHWKDSERDELETGAADDKRELMVHLFYPTNAGDREPLDRREPLIDADGRLGQRT